MYETCENILSTSYKTCRSLSDKLNTLFSRRKYYMDTIEKVNTASKKFKFNHLDIAKIVVKKVLV